MCAGSTPCLRLWSSGGTARVRQIPSMDDFMQHAVNGIAKSNKATPGVVGYVFDRADGSQMAFWTCR